MPRNGSRKKPMPKKASPTGIARAEVAEVFTAGLKEARTLFELKILSRLQYLEYQNFLNKEYANHLKLAGGGNIGAAQQLLNSISKHKKEQLNVATNLDVKKRAQETIPKTNSAKGVVRSGIKKRQGISTRVQLDAEVKRRKKDQQRARFFRRFRDGQTLEEIRLETGVATATIKKYVQAEAEKRGVKYSDLLIENKKNKKNGAKPKTSLTKKGVAAENSVERKKVAERIERPVVYANPTEKGSRLASAQALKISAQIEELNSRGRKSGGVSKTMVMRDEISNLENKRQILIDYMYGRLPKDHKVAKFLAGIK